MKITNTVHEMGTGRRSGIPERQTITIEIEAGDDELGLINGLIIRERLDAFLRVWAQPSTLGNPQDEDEAYSLLSRFAFMAVSAESRLDDLLWACRDTLGWTWDKIAGASDLHPSAVRRRVAKTRERAAEGGRWRDRTGYHEGNRADARAELAAREQADPASGYPDIRQLPEG